MEGIIKAIGWPHLAFLFAVFFVLLFRVEPIYPPREAKSEHPVVTLLCGAQFI